MTLSRWKTLLFAVSVLTLTANTQAAPTKAPLIKILFPRETIQRDGRPVQFSWQAMPDTVAVEKYDLTLYLFDSTGTNPRIINRTSVLKTAPLTAELGGILSTGIYAWKVEAKDKSGTVLGAGQTRFIITTEAFRRPGKFFLQAGVSLLDISYTSKTATLQGEVPGSFFGFSASLEYYLRSNWTAFLNFTRSSMNFSGASLAYSDLAIGGSRRSVLDKSEDWHLILGMKLSMNSMPQLTPQADYSFIPSTVKRNSLTPFAGVDYRIADHATIYSRLSLGMNLSTSNPDQGTLTAVNKSISYALSGGIRGMWMPPWGYNLETTYLNDGFGYTTPSQVIDTSYRGYNVLLAASRSF